MTTTNQFSLSPDTSSLFQIFNLPKANSSYLFSDIIKIITDETPQTGASTIPGQFTLPEDQSQLTTGKIIDLSGLIKLLLNSLKAEQSGTADKKNILKGDNNSTGEKYLISAEDLKSFLKQAGLENTTSTTTSSGGIVIEISPELLSKLAKEIKTKSADTCKNNFAVLEGAVPDNKGVNLNPEIDAVKTDDKKDNIKIVFKKLEPKDTDFLLTSGQLINTPDELSKFFAPALTFQGNMGVLAGEQDAKTATENIPLTVNIAEDLKTGDPVVNSQGKVDNKNGNVYTEVNIPNENLQAVETVFPDITKLDTPAVATVSPDTTKLTAPAVETISPDITKLNTPTVETISPDITKLNKPAVETVFPDVTNLNTLSAPGKATTVIQNDNSVKINIPEAAVKQDAGIIVENTSPENILIPDSGKNSQSAAIKPGQGNIFTLTGKDGNNMGLQNVEADNNVVVAGNTNYKAADDKAAITDLKNLVVQKTPVDDIKIEIIKSANTKVQESQKFFTADKATDTAQASSKFFTADKSVDTIQTPPQFFTADKNIKTDNKQEKTAAKQINIPAKQKADNESLVNNLKNEKSFANNVKSFSNNALPEEPADAIYPAGKIFSIDKNSNNAGDKNLYEVIINKPSAESSKEQGHVPLYNKDVQFKKDNILPQDFNALDFNGFKREAFTFKSNITKNIVSAASNEKPSLKAENKLTAQNDENQKNKTVILNDISGSVKKAPVEVVSEIKARNEKPGNVEANKIQTNEKDHVSETKPGNGDNSKDASGNSTAEQKTPNDPSHDTEAQDRFSIPKASFNDLLAVDKQKPVEKVFTADIRDIKTPALVEELNKIISKGEKSNATIHLSPENLGKVKIVVDVTNSVVNAKIEVENESVKQFVQNSIEQLKQSLQQNGVQLNSCTISLSTSDQKSTGKFRPKNSEKSGNGKNNLKPGEEITSLNTKSMGYNTYEYLA